MFGLPNSTFIVSLVLPFFIAILLAIWGIFFSEEEDEKWNG